VVELVLDDGRDEPLGLDLDRLAVEVGVAELHLRRSLHLLVVFGNREAALLVGALLLGGPGDLRVDQHHRPALLLGLLRRVHHDEPLRHADLDRREADAGGVVHRVEHVGGEPAQLRRDLVHRLGFETQARVGEDDKGTNGHGGEIGARRKPVKSFILRS
jgi:hypothetical protein